MCVMMRVVVGKNRFTMKQQIAYCLNKLLLFLFIFIPTLLCNYLEVYLISAIII